MTFFQENKAGEVFFLPFQGKVGGEYFFLGREGEQDFLLFQEFHFRLNIGQW